MFSPLIVSFLNFNIIVQKWMTMKDYASDGSIEEIVIRNDFILDLRTEFNMEIRTCFMKMCK